MAKEHKEKQPKQGRTTRRKSKQIKQSEENDMNQTNMRQCFTCHHSSPHEMNHSIQHYGGQHWQNRDTIRTAMLALHNNIFYNTSTPFDVQDICSRVGSLYTQMLEFAVDIGTPEEDGASMDWQWEPTTPVYLVRMPEEEACYPNGVVARPWETRQ
jgi:hypothetical protein